MPRIHDHTIDDRILDAADAEIERRGLVGLRVADVAERAGTTVAMVYRIFDDRDGLLAATLMRFYRRRLEQLLAMARSLVTGDAPISIEDVLAATPPFRYEGSDIAHLRMQRVYVAAIENPRLQLAFRQIVAEFLPEFERAIDAIVDRLPDEEKFDPRIYTIAVLRHNAILDDVLGDAGLTNEEFTAFLRRTMRNSTIRNSSPARRH